MAIVLPCVAAAGDMLVTTDWLANHLTDDDLVLLHVGSEKDYTAGHIPNARLVTLQDISVTGERGRRLELPAVDALERAFGKFGISERSRIVVYSGNDVVQSATRVWFTLDYLGLGERASLLNGGLSLWRSEGRSIVTGAPAQVAAVDFKARSRPELVVDAEWIRIHTTDPAIALVDARTPEFYNGASAGMMPRAGHIPGAINIPFTTLLDEQRRLKSPEDLAALLVPAKNKLMIAYCHLGQQATLLYFAARYLGVDARLYDGSFQDWSTRPGLPVKAAAVP